MSKPVEIVALVEGQTENIFVRDLIQPYLANRSVFITSNLLSKPGRKGGDVKFSRAQRDIGSRLKQRPDTWVTLFVDYYGIDGDWSGHQRSKATTSHISKAQIMNKSTAEKVNELFGAHGSETRFIPYISMFEIEALLFSDAEILADKLKVNRHQVDTVLAQCEPEQINDSPHTAPSRRLQTLSKPFKKIATVIDIARAIGIPKMRAACPLFNNWISTLENLQH